MYVTIVAGTLVRLMLLHEWDEFLGFPSFSLEIIVVRGTSSCVHHLWSSQHQPLHQSFQQPTKLILDPPPRMLAHGTIALRPANHLEGLEW